MPADSVQKAIDLLEQGRAEQAAPLLEDVVDALPAYAGAYVLLARAYEAGERWNRALGAWREALMLVPDSPVAMEGIRRALRHGRREAAFTPGADAASVSEVEALHQEAPSRPSNDAPLERLAEESTAEQPSTPIAPEAPESAAAAPAEPPRPARSNLAGSPADDNLERLISELEGARITPRPDLDDIPAPDFEDDIEDMVSETLARIYASQGQHLEAARVYDALAEQHPERRSYFHQKAREMRDVGGASE